jgi:uncharacterized membrane protein SpoIIM required for sporulation
MLKKLILIIMVVLLVWLFLVSVVGISAEELPSPSQQSSLQEVCDTIKNSCTQTVSSDNSNFTLQILAYLMILVGSSFLVINWRLSSLEDN